MGAVDKWAERVYVETDFGRSVATTLSGLLGLGVYLALGDWVIAAFAAIIFFPVTRVTATAIHSHVSRGAKRRAKKSDSLATYNSLSDEEKSVVCEFVAAGGCVMTWGQMNKASISGSAIESLIQRDILSTSMTADGMRETFVLDPDIFDVGVSRAKLQSAP